MAALWIGSIGLALAAPGDLDPSFADRGRRIVDFPDSYEAGTSISLQADRKILVGREDYTYETSDDFSVLRLDPDGSLDSTFGVGGKASVKFPEFHGATSAVLQQADGRVVAAGWAGNSPDLDPRVFALARYTAAGALDATFGDGGIVRETLDATTSGSIVALVEQADGRLVAAGTVTTSSGDEDMAFARFNTDGSLDGSFGSSGSLILDFGGALLGDVVGSLIQQPDGKLVASGLAARGGLEFAVVRLTRDGTLDTTFGQGGRTRVGVPGADRIWRPARLQLQTDGKLVVAGAIRSAASRDCMAVVARLNPDGSLDSTFAGDGRTSQPLGTCGSPGPLSLVVEPNGSILLGTTLAAASTDPFVVRLTAAGELDSTFGSNGRAIVDIGTGYSQSYADESWGVHLARQSDGRILVVASDVFDWWGSGYYFAVARLLTTGSSPGVIGMRRAYFEMTEGTDPSGYFAIRRTGGSAGAVSVNFEIRQSAWSSRSATFPANGTLNWSDGDAGDKTIEVRLADDAQAQGSESIELTLSDPEGGSGLATAVGALVIRDDEAAPSPPPAPPAPTGGNSGGGGGACVWTLLLALASALAARRRRLTRDGRFSAPASA